MAGFGFSDPKSKACKDWEIFLSVLLIAVGIAGISPGAMSDREDHPGFRVPMHLHPERLARSFDPKFGDEFSRKRTQRSQK